MLMLPAILGPVGFLLAAMPILLPVMATFKRLTGRWPTSNELVDCSCLMALAALRIYTWIWP